MTLSPELMKAILSMDSYNRGYEGGALFFSALYFFAAARVRRSLIASPIPVSGIFMTAMAL